MAFSQHNADRAAYNTLHFAKQRVSIAGYQQNPGQQNRLNISPLSRLRDTDLIVVNIMFVVLRVLPYEN